jgi:N-acetylgalactosamine-6-sulfatase
VVLILADDLGYGDLGCYGCPDIKTPHIDRLAKQGLRFISFYSNGPECTPTRTALLTGRYQQRVGGLECAIGIGNVGRYDDAIRLRAANDLGLPVSEATLAPLLEKAGYSTAIVGKWHLGYEAKFLSDKHGFDYSFGPLGGAVDYFHHTEPGGEPMLYENGKPVRRDGYLTDLVTAGAERVIREKHAKSYFLYVPYTAPHSPFQGPDDRPARPLTAAESEAGSREKYRAMVERLDAGVGKLLAAIEETGQAERTLVIFTSDNGGPRYARNAPFSGNKGTTFEGGIRVPCVVRWPREPYLRGECDDPTMTFDLTASILNAAGVEVPEGRRLDGIGVLQRLAKGTEAAPRTLFWRQRRGERTWRAVRDGSLKFVSRQDGDKVVDFLFDLTADPGEKENLLARRPDDVKRLKDLLSAWEREVKPSR